MNKEFNKTISTFKEDIANRFPEISKEIEDIHFEKGTLGGSLRSKGVYMAMDSRVCEKEAVPFSYQGMPSPIRVEMPVSTQRYIDQQMDSLISRGFSEKDAEKQVKGSLQTFFGFDPATRQYVVSSFAPSSVNKDSLLEKTSIPMWNIGYMTKIIRQPYVGSHAKKLVSVESFSNPWADVIALFKASFEGFGKLSTVAKGNYKINNSNPVTSEASQIVDNVFNLSVDFESDTMEDIQAGIPGNFVTGQMKAQRQRYASMVLERLQDALIYFGSEEAGLDGLANATTIEAYTGTPLNAIFKSTTSKTRGSDILRALQTVVGNFLLENHYMARKVKINVSEYVFQALTQTVYSDEFNADSPLKIFQTNFNIRNELDGGSVSVPCEICSDTMLNPSLPDKVNPFNPEAYDLMFITAPSIEDDMGNQDSLIIHPELIKSYIVPALWQRSGLLYTMYKRIGGVIAPVEGTVKVISGFGYQG